MAAYTIVPFSFQLCRVQGLSDPYLSTITATLQCPCVTLTHLFTTQGSLGPPGDVGPEGAMGKKVSIPQSCFLNHFLTCLNQTSEIWEVYKWKPRKK